MRENLRRLSPDVPETGVTMTAVQTHTLDVPGATVTYDVHGDAGGVPLLLFGSPMDARGFAHLAGRFEDRTVVTYDPRGTGRSPRTDPSTESTPDDHAADIAAVIEAVGAGPADVFGTSGGAINALALVAARPELVRTLVAHEPPLATVLPDRDAALAAIADVGDTYRASGLGPAMAKFIVLTQWAGPFPDDAAAAPGPDPAVFGLPTTDDGSRDDALLAQNLRTSTGYRPRRRRTAHGVHPDRRRRRRGERRADGRPRRPGAGGSARGRGRRVPQPPRRLHGTRVRLPGDPEGFAVALRAALGCATLRTSSPPDRGGNARWWALIRPSR